MSDEMKDFPSHLISKPKDFKDYSQVTEHHYPNGITEWRVGSVVLKRAKVNKNGILVTE